MKLNLSFFFAGLLAVSIGGCKSSTPAPEATGGGAAATGASATAKMEARSDSKVSGNATFTEEAGAGVKIVLEVEGATPGEHAVHVHQTGDCSAPDAKSAGDHFTPASEPHGFPHSPEHHLGDLGNMKVGDDGKGRLEITVPGATLAAGAPNSFAGRALIVHEKVDTGEQPAGNAGARVACGVIEAAKS